MTPKENINLLRQMLNTEVNTAMFNPDVRDHTPEKVIIIIENSDGHIHCICPEEGDTKRMFASIDYFKYLKAKVNFTEDIVDNLMERYDKGGTLPVFPTFEEWKEQVNFN